MIALNWDDCFGLNSKKNAIIVSQLVRLLFLWSRLKSANVHSFSSLSLHKFTQTWNRRYIAIATVCFWIMCVFFVDTATTGNVHYKPFSTLIIFNAIHVFCSLSLSSINMNDLLRSIDDILFKKDFLMIVHFLFMFICNVFQVEFLNSWTYQRSFLGSCSDSMLRL